MTPTPFTCRWIRIFSFGHFVNYNNDVVEFKMNQWNLTVARLKTLKVLNAKTSVPRSCISALKTDHFKG